MEYDIKKVVGKWRIFLGGCWLGDFASKEDALIVVRNLILNPSPLSNAIKMIHIVEDLRLKGIIV